MAPAASVAAVVVVRREKEVRTVYYCLHNKARPGRPRSSSVGGTPLPRRMERSMLLSLLAAFFFVCVCGVCDCCCLAVAKDSKAKNNS